MKKLLNLLFVVVAVATILEYLLVCGTFSGPAMAALSLLVGLLNAVFSLRGQKPYEALLFLLATAALVMGYAKLMLF